MGFSNVLKIALSQLAPFSSLLQWEFVKYEITQLNWEVAAFKLEAWTSTGQSISLNIERNRNTIDVLYNIRDEKFIFDGSAHMCDLYVYFTNKDWSCADHNVLLTRGLASLHSGWKAINPQSGLPHSTPSTHYTARHI